MHARFQNTPCTENVRYAALSFTNTFEAAVDVKYIAIYKYLIHLAPPSPSLCFDALLLGPM